MKIKEFEELIFKNGFERMHRNSPIADRDYINRDTIREIAIRTEGGFVTMIVVLNEREKDIDSFLSEQYKDALVKAGIPLENI